MFYQNADYNIHLSYSPLCKIVIDLDYDSVDNHPLGEQCTILLYVSHL